MAWWPYIQLGFAFLLRCSPTLLAISDNSSPRPILVLTSTKVPEQVVNMSYFVLNLLAVAAHVRAQTISGLGSSRSTQLYVSLIVVCIALEKHRPTHILQAFPF